jgi:VanZ family protein
MFYTPGRTTIIWALVILVLSLLPASDTGDFGSIPYLDKVIHIIFYAVLCFLILHDIRSGERQHNSYFSDLFQAFSYALVFGILIEMLQWIIPYRSFELMDILANALGALCALLIFFLFYHDRVADKN